MPPHSNLPYPSQLAPRPETVSPTTPLSAPLPPPAGRVRAAIHCTPLCYGPLPRDCRGALGAPPAPWARGGRQRGALGGARPGGRRQKTFIFPIHSPCVSAPDLLPD